MKIETAILSSIKGGWLPENVTAFTDGMYVFKDGHKQVFTLPTKVELAYTVLQLGFWQALAKSEGWYWTAYKNGAWETEFEDKTFLSDTPFRYPTEIYHMHRLIDAIVSGQSIEEFFATL